MVFRILVLLLLIAPCVPYVVEGRVKLKNIPRIPEVRAVVSQGVKDKIDTFLAANQGTISALQDAYFATNGKYFQGLETHTTAPVGGADETPDNLDAKPTDQAEKWADFGVSFPAKFPVSVRADVYDGPDGKGWLLVLFVTDNGKEHMKIVNFGPETWRNCDWVEIN